MTAKEKNRLAGIFLMAHGGFLGVTYLLMFGFFALIMNSDPNLTKGFFAVFMSIIALFSTAFVVPQIIGGWKMYKEQSNAKNWGIAGSILACLNAPLGTAAGVFALIFLFGDEGKQFYSSQENPKYLGEINQVEEFQFNNSREREPHSWR